MAEATSTAEPSNRLLRRLFKGLERRRSMSGAARVEIDKQISTDVDALLELERQPIVERLEVHPPRPLAVALATALYAQPHLSVLLGDMEAQDGVHAPARFPSLDAPLVFTPDALQDALGLPTWELEDIREDVDRRVGVHLKQARALCWLWAHFGLPEASAEPLFRVLFTAAPGRINQLGMVRCGSQLYAVTGQDTPPPVQTMYLPWIAADEEKAMHPLRTFTGKYVNAGLRKSLSRSIGASDEETIELLDRMVTVVPRTGCEAFVAHDGWRARGGQAISDLPSPYGACAWLVRPLAPEDVAYTSWLRHRDGKLEVRDVKAAFDVLALPRVNEMLRQVYGELLARLQNENPHTATSFNDADGILLDVERHLRGVLDPVVEWARSPRTAAYIATTVGVSNEKVARALDDVAREWTAQLDTAWCAPPAEGEPRSVQALITDHLIVTRDTLRRLLARAPDSRAPHRDVVLMFAAHWFATAPLERLWAEATALPDGQSSSSVDPIGHWFWPTWIRLLESSENHQTVELDDEAV